MLEVVPALDRREYSFLGSEAYEWILNAITSFALPVNAQLSDSKLSKEMGVSRTPVREALQRLEKEGLVRRGPTSRFTVALLTPREVDESCDVLAVLDSYIFCRAAERIDSVQALELMGCAEAMLSSAVRGDVKAWGIADSKFHEIVLQASGNDIAADMARQTRRRIHRFSTRALGAQANRFISCSSEHVGIAQQVLDGRVSDIPAMVNEHIEHMRLSVLDSLTAISNYLGLEIPPRT